MTVHVFATTPLDTRVALRTARRLAGNLGATLRIIVPKEVCFGIRAERPAPPPTSAIDMYRALASEMGIEADVQLCLCRHESDLYRVLLPDRSTIVIGGRRRSWPWRNATERAARALERLGHRVVVADRT